MTKGVNRQGVRSENDRIRRAGDRPGQEQRSGANTREDHGEVTRCMVRCMAQEVVPYRCMVYAWKL
jgi:hypothetical protein